MSSEPMVRRPRSLALRLTLWYAGVFAGAAALALVFAYGLIATTIQARMDEDLLGDVEEYAGLYRADGLARVEQEIGLDTRGDEAEKTFLRVWTRGGGLALSSDLEKFPGLPEPPPRLFEASPSDKPVVTTLELPGQRYPVRAVYGAIAPDAWLEIGESLEDDREFLASLVRGLAFPLLGFVALSLPVGWLLARRALRGVESMTRTATEIAAGALEQRVPLHGDGDELERLAHVFNGMLDRIQALVVGLREMADHLAHDLRSPLTRIRAAAELAQGRRSADRDELSLAATATEECDRLLELIDTNLEITETESGAVSVRLAPVDLTELARDACDLFQTVAEDRNVELLFLASPPCPLRCDRQRLQRVIANLLDNALKYTPSGGQVSVALFDEATRVRLRVADNGVGIHPDEQSKIFERFYRSDRSRSQPGNGLGLALSLASVRAHGGEISVESEPGRGSSFTVTLFR